MKCIHCGKELLDGDLFCDKCGKSQELNTSASAFGFRPALDLNAGVVETEATPAPVAEDIPLTVASSEVPKSMPSVAPVPVFSGTRREKVSVLDLPSKPIIPPEEAEPIIVPEPARVTAKPVVPVIPKRKLANWKMLGCIAVVLALIVGGVYAVVEGDFFSGSGSKSSKSGSKKSKKDHDDHYDDSDYDHYDDPYDDSYDDPYDDFYDPQPSYFDCPGCTNGWHDLCNGTGTYSNYGFSSDCTCDDGICTQCGGEGIIYYN